MLLSKEHSSRGGRSKSSRGQSIVELLAGLIVLIPVILFLVDLVVIYTAIQLNDSTARDAARAASTGRPAVHPPSGNPETSLARARAVVDRVYQGGPTAASGNKGYVTGPIMEDLGSVDGEGQLNTGPRNVTVPGQFGGQYGGSYRVTTRVVVSLPASIPGLPPTVTFRSRQEFPITFTEGNSASPN